MRVRKLSLALGATAAGVATLGALPALGADHRDAPLTTASPRIDINDVYVFKSGANAVAVMTVNPLTSPADTAGLMLDTNAVYEFKWDFNGDAKADAAHKFTFSGSGPVQDVTVRHATGVDAILNDPSGAAIGTGKTSTGAGVTTITLQGGAKAYVGPRDDPFFFDLAGFRAGLNFTGVDTFKGTNVTAIVLEVPASSFPAQAGGLWATTSKVSNLGGWSQLERMGRPAIATVFIPSDQKDAFNSNAPDRDVAIYKDEVTAALNSLGSPATDTLAGLLLPDILTFDLAKDVKYLNGRGLADDVIDISLQAITGNNAAGDKVNANDKAFLAAFPYLAEAHGATAAGPGGVAPGAPNTGSGLAAADGDGVLPGKDWTLPAGLIAAAGLLFAAGWVNRRRASEQA